MKLCRIDTTRCPVCDCSTVISERIARDEADAGGYNAEYREFYCGTILKSGQIAAIPEVIKDCPLKKEILEKQASREKARTDVLNFVDSLKVDNSFKNHLRGVINSTTIHY